MIYFTSDLHFGHQNIISYCSRPFSSVDEMNDDLVRRWNATVSDEDTIYVLGDVAMGQLEHSLSWVNKLAGTKLLVPGNHDKCWAGKKRNPSTLALYEEVGFTVLPENSNIEIGGLNVELCHFPFAGDTSGEDRYGQWRPVTRGQWLLCGHVHDLWRQRGRQINVGIDAWGGRLVQEAEIAALIASGPSDLECLAWEKA